MKTKVFLLFLSVIGIGLLTGCHVILERPSKTVINRQYKVNRFNALDIDAMGDVTFVQSKDGKYSVSIKGPENYVKKYFSVEVEGGTLSIQSDEDNHFYNAHIKIQISAPTLTSIETDGICKFHADSLLAGKLKIAGGDASNVSIGYLSANSLTVITDDAAKIDIKGKVHDATLTCEDAATIVADALQAKVVNSNCYDAGHATCFATDSLTAIQEDAATLKYKGQPAYKKFDSTDTGTVKPY
jgi:hypothetical protein